MTTQMTAEETQKYMRNLAASTSKSVLESLEQARLHGIPMQDMREALSSTMREHLINPLTENDPTVQEFKNDPINTTKKYDRMKTIEGEYQSVTQLLIDANLMNHDRQWTDGVEPDKSKLSPDLQRAVDRYHAAHAAALKAGILAPTTSADTTTAPTETGNTPPTLMQNIKAVSAHALHMTMRSPVAEDSTFRWIMNSRMDIDAKLAIILACAPIMVAVVPITYLISQGIDKLKATAEIDRSVTETLNSPEVLQNLPLLEGPKYRELLERMGEAEATTEALECGDLKLLTHNTPETIDLQTLSTPPPLAPAIELEPGVELIRPNVQVLESWGTTSEELQEMITTERQRLAGSTGETKLKTSRSLA